MTISPMPRIDNTYKLRNQEFLQEYAQKYDETEEMLFGNPSSSH